MTEIRPESVLMGRDRDALMTLLALHAKPAAIILDCTYNAGKMWKGTPFKPVRMDIDPLWDLDVVGDFTAIPFADASFDVLVFDPPHLPNCAGTEASDDGFKRRYGLTDKNDANRSGDDVSPCFDPFLAEAKRVLKPGGIILAKISDLIHNHRYQWQHVDFVQAVRDAGMTACDLLIKRDPSGGMKSGKWVKTHHLKRRHCYWIVVRNSSKCEGR